jgi:hypothetical protein
MWKASIVACAGIVCLLNASGQVHAAYRNLALNPNDYHDSTDTNPKKTYPHATSNSETRWRTENSFWALRAIDGIKNNTGAEPSWGPEQPWTVPGPWWKVSFDKTYEIDSIVILIRALFATSAGGSNHDTYFKTATLNFSDGSKQSITIDSTSKPQTYKLNKIKTNFILLNNLLEAQPLPANNKWAAITEFEAWGQDTSAVGDLRQSSLSTNLRSQSAATMIVPCLSRLSVPTYFTGLDVFTLAGKKVWSFRRASAGNAVSMNLPPWIGAQIVRIVFTK